MTAARTLTDADVAAIADAVERRLRPKRSRRTRPEPIPPTREDRARADAILRRAGARR